MGSPNGLPFGGLRFADEKKTGQTEVIHIKKAPFRVLFFYFTVISTTSLTVAVRIRGPQVPAPEETMAVKSPSRRMP